MGVDKSDILKKMREAEAIYVLYQIAFRSVRSGDL